MAESNLVAIVKDNGTCVFIKSEKRDGRGKVVEKRIYNIRKTDETLAFGSDRSYKGQYKFQFDDSSGELSLTYQKTDRIETISMGRVENIEEAEDAILYLISPPAK